MNPKITKLVITNFGCIGAESVVVDIDKIVVLVGANNSGKSTVLRAFEAVTDHLKLDLDDFHNREINSNALPEIEVHSVVNASTKPGNEWCLPLNEGSWLVREQWTWLGTNIEPKRVGRLAGPDRWATSSDPELAPWGLNNVAKARRPKPHRVCTFDSPDHQAKATTSLLKSLLEDGIKILKHDAADDESRYDKILAQLITLRADSKASQAQDIEQIQTQVNAIMNVVFPGLTMKIVTPGSPAPISIELLGDEFSLEMGGVNAPTFPLSRQGSGTQRTALWAILKLLADRGVRARQAAKNAKSFHEPVGQNTAHVLLIDEPEVSLHPKAVQAARDVLYALPQSDNWQVMVTTHSPSFIDLTKDHTTIIRVERGAAGVVGATTLYRPETARLDEDDKKNLKLTNMFDSHISEAFFGGRILVVEGDTEYSAFSYVIEQERLSGGVEFRDISIIRARGKVTVASMMKVLNHFKSPYYVLHDSDRPRTTSKVRLGQEGEVVSYRLVEIANPAWTNNSKICAEMSETSRVVCSIVNFEEAYFAQAANSNKPGKCIERMKSDAAAYELVKQLLKAVLELDNVPLPKGALAWRSVEDLASAVASWDHDNVIVDA